MDKAAADFEAVFIGQMFEQMWSEVKTDGPFGGGTGERVFRSLMIQEHRPQIAGQGGIGLADSVKRELIAMQEAKQPMNATAEDLIALTERLAALVEHDVAILKGASALRAERKTTNARTTLLLHYGQIARRVQESRAAVTPCPRRRSSA